ncbi:hypothetical protein [Clostridium sp. JS66]|uniref:hypothetical protein n=1 Tax=Clostridium sp. JS66 TaxID=3064705 RepID=UPI00298E3F18|nr:hypothetical protein [Clostridium sp. JS66]WPC41686.1 hypothetical protein Q6H37_28105 [Clostridium sp. JS66]
MFDYDKQQFLIASMILMISLFITTISNTLYNSNYNLKQQINIPSKSITFINLEETPDDISRNYQIAIINSINQKEINKK